MDNPTRIITYTPAAASNIAPPSTGAGATGTTGLITGIQVTVLGTTDLTIYDNTNAASGDIVAIVPHTAILGTWIPVVAHWQKGLYASGAVTAPACSIHVSD